MSLRWLIRECPHERLRLQGKGDRFSYGKVTTENWGRVAGLYPLTRSSAAILSETNKLMPGFRELLPGGTPGLSGGAKVGLSSGYVRLAPTNQGEQDITKRFTLLAQAIRVTNGVVLIG